MRKGSSALRLNDAQLRQAIRQSEAKHFVGYPQYWAWRLTGVKKDELDTALGYFENNAPRMRYHWFRSRGLFVGSGAVESGCKAVIGQRLKLSGMRWNIPGATGILTLRCQQASNRWEHIWRQPHNQTASA